MKTLRNVIDFIRVSLLGGSMMHLHRLVDKRCPDRWRASYPVAELLIWGYIRTSQMKAFYPFVWKAARYEAGKMRKHNDRVLRSNSSQDCSAVQLTLPHMQEYTG